MTPELVLDSVARTHRRGIVRYLRLLGCDEATADDLAQEAFLALLGVEFEYRDPRPTAAWLRRKARYLYLSSLRARDRRRETRLTEIAEEVWHECARDDDGEGYVRALRECVRALPPRSREVVRLRYAEGASRAAMARALGLGPNGVKTLLQRVRAALRRCVERRRFPR